MATLSLDDPRFQPLTPEEEERRKKQKKITEENKEDLVSAGVDETDIELAVEQNNEVSGLTSFAAGIVSGAIKIPEGVVSLTAELFDLGGGKFFGIPTPDAEGMTEALGKQFSYAAEVEKFFDKLNPFEELAEERAAGKISEALTQLVGFGTVGAKLTVKGVESAAKMLAKKAVRAKNLADLLVQKS